MVEKADDDDEKGEEDGELRGNCFETVFCPSPLLMLHGVEQSLLCLVLYVKPVMLMVS